MGLLLGIGAVMANKLVKMYEMNASGATYGKLRDWKILFKKMSMV